MSVDVPLLKRKSFDIIISATPYDTIIFKVSYPDSGSGPIAL